MADLTAAANGSSGIAFLVSAGVMLEAIAAWCSSPQTTELNADKRSGTLMKWVGLGLLGGTILVVTASYVEPKNRVPILAGGAMAGALLGLSYVHAKRAGTGDGKPGTETY